MPFSKVQWTLFMPHKANVAAQGEGAWCLTIEPRQDFAGFGWHVAHSIGRASRGGSASSVNFAKAQAEMVAAEMEALASLSVRSGSAPA